MALQIGGNSIFITKQAMNKWHIQNPQIDVNSVPRSKSVKVHQVTEEQANEFAKCCCAK